VQVGPRAELPQWNSAKTVSRPIDPADADDPAVWAVSCFFMTSKQRGKGLSHRMLSEAIVFAAQSGARVLEACPIDRTKQSKSVGLYVGSTRIFEAAGFSEVARRKDGRPLMRLEL
jgi:predicted GNAT family acetyltransferase